MGKKELKRKLKSVEEYVEFLRGLSEISLGTSTEQGVYADGAKFDRGYAKGYYMGMSESYAMAADALEARLEDD